MQKIKHIQVISLTVLLLLGGCADHTPAKAIEAQTIAQQACTALYAKNPQKVGSFDRCYAWVANSIYNGKSLSALARETHSYREGDCTGRALKRNTPRWQACVVESKLTLAGIDSILSAPQKEEKSQQYIQTTNQQNPIQSVEAHNQGNLLERIEAMSKQCERLQGSFRKKIECKNEVNREASQMFNVTPNPIQLRKNELYRLSLADLVDKGKITPEQFEYMELEYVQALLDKERQNEISKILLMDSIKPKVVYAPNAPTSIDINQLQWEIRRLNEALQNRY